MWLVAVLIAVRLVLMAFTPVFDPSEARYAVMSANMARSGDFTVPHFTYNGVYQSFDGKPPLVFQAGGVFCKLFGVNEFAVRLFPFLCALLMGFIVHHSVKRFSDSEHADLAVLMYASMSAFYATAGFAMTDVPLAVSVAGALLLYRCFCDGWQMRYAAGVAALLGAGMIIKGPVSFVLFGIPVFFDAVINRRWRGIFNVRWLYVLPIYLLIAVPWFVIVEQRNPGAVEYFFVNENFKRFLVHDYGDKYGAGRETFRGMAIVWTFVATLPWALVPVWEGMRRLVEKRKGMAFSSVACACDWRSFPLISVLGITFFWSLTSRTLVSYLLPVAPMFAAYLAVKGNVALLRRLASWATGITVSVISIALVGGMFSSPKMRGSESPQFYGFRNRYSHEFYHGTAKECVGDQVDVMRLYLEAKKASANE